jgi:hypothetical protein
MWTAEQLCEELKREFYRCIQFQPALQIFALLDSNCPVASKHPLHRQRLQQREISPTLIDVARADLAHEPSLCPQLLLLRTRTANGYVDEALFAEIARSALERSTSMNGTYVAGWLLGESDAEDIARHIERASVCVDLVQARRRVLPYFEPHRLALVASMQITLGQEKRFTDQLLGPIRHWYYLSLANELKSVSCSVGSSAQGLKLTRPMWDAQHRIDSARRVAMALMKSTAMIPTNPELAIDHELALAQSKGLVDLEDLMFFCLNSFTLSNRWHEHPSAKDAIARCVRGELPLTEGLSALSDEQLESIATHGRTGIVGT